MRSGSGGGGLGGPRGARWVRAAALAVLGGGALTGPAVAQPQAAATLDVEVEVVARGLEHPWAVAFLPGGRWLVTERAGRLRVVAPDGQVGPPVEGLPPIQAGGQGGLLDVITDRDHAQNRTVHFCYTEPGLTPDGRPGNSTAWASARLSEDLRRLEDVQVRFSQRPKWAGSLHFGCRLVHAPDGLVYLALGERFQRASDAQTLDNHHGKVVRLRADGTVPPDNPFVGRPGALPEIWSLGHRNPQGATWGADGRLWITEHGPQGGDEVNRPTAGANHGWPVVTHGERYGGGPIGSGASSAPGMAPPWHQWTPSIAPSGLVWVQGDRYPGWRGSLLVGALKARRLVRLVPDGDRPPREQVLLARLDRRIRDVRQAPDGWLFVLTDERDGQLLRLRPVPAPPVSLPGSGGTP